MVLIIFVWGMIAGTFGGVMLTAATAPEVFVKEHQTQPWCNEIDNIDQKLKRCFIAKEVGENGKERLSSH